MHIEEKLAGMNKLQLRSACRDAKVKGYSKMKNEEMRKALAGAGDYGAAVEYYEQEEAAAAKAEELRAAALEVAAEKRSAEVVATPPEEKKAAPPADTVKGTKRPKAGGKCAAVWNYLDAHPGTTLKEIKAVAAEKGWSVGNASQEIYAWRRASGITGRVK